MKKIKELFSKTKAPDINDIFKKYATIEIKNFDGKIIKVMDEERFTQAIAEIISLPVEAQVSQENGDLHEITLRVYKHELVDLVSDLTYNNDNFNPDEWSEFDGERLKKASDIILSHFSG